MVTSRSTGQSSLIEGVPTHASEKRLAEAEAEVRAGVVAPHNVAALVAVVVVVIMGALPEVGQSVTIAVAVTNPAGARGALGVNRVMATGRWITTAEASRVTATTTPMPMPWGPQMASNSGVLCAKQSLVT
jgi:hypothetical protein